MRSAIQTVGVLLAVSTFALTGCSDNADNNAPPANNAPAATNPADAKPAGATDAASTTTDATKPVIPAAAGDTPQAAFSRYQTALKNKDYKTAFTQETPASQDLRLGALASTLNMVAAVDPSKEPDIRKIRDTYGIKNLDLTSAAPDAQSAAIKDMVADVKDKPGCMAEIITWMENNAPQKASAAKMIFGDAVDAELVDVKIDGDTAMGDLKSNSAGADKNNALKFKLIDGKWMIDLSDTIPAVPPQLN
jgi:hypothetical protein